MRHRKVKALRNRKESFIDRAGLDAIDALAKCRDDLVLRPVASPTMSYNGERMYSHLKF